MVTILILPTIEGVLLNYSKILSLLLYIIYKQVFLLKDNSLHLPSIPNPFDQTDSPQKVARAPELCNFFILQPVL